MKLLSVNVSLGKDVPYKGKTVTTGIFKEPVNGRVMLRGSGYDLRPHLSGFNTLMVITASRRPEWTSALVSLRRQGINVTVCYVDHTSFTEPGGEPSTGTTGQAVAEYLAQHDIPIYIVRRGADINRALSRPLAVGGARVSDASGGPADAADVTSADPVAGPIA